MNALALYRFVVKSRIGGALIDLCDALMGIVYHLTANDDICHDMHKYCNKGAGSFCIYQKAVGLGDIIPKHPRCISTACKDRIFNILVSYFEVPFLEKVQGGNISNLNENFHGIMYKQNKTG